MIVNIVIERVPDEGEDQKDLIETKEMPFGIGTTAAQFDYDPTSKESWKYLLDLQEALFQLFRHEMMKAEITESKGKINVG